MAEVKTDAGEARGHRVNDQGRLIKAHGIEPDTILVSSWGYDQTNVNFYQVVRTTKTQVIPQPMTTRIISHGRGSDYVVPGKVDSGAKKIRRKVKEGYRGNPVVYLNSFEVAKVWDGKAKRQTAFGYGH